MYQLRLKDVCAFTYASFLQTRDLFISSWLVCHGKIFKRFRYSMVKKNKNDPHWWRNTAYEAISHLSRSVSAAFFWWRYDTEDPNSCAPMVSTYNLQSVYRPAVTTYTFLQARAHQIYLLHMSSIPSSANPETHYIPFSGRTSSTRMWCGSLFHARYVLPFRNITTI